MRSTFPLLVLLLGLTIWTPAAQPQATAPPTVKLNCDHWYEQSLTQGEMNQCAARDAKEANRRLNIIYRKLLAQFKNEPAAVQKLREVERAWILYRDEDMAALWPLKDTDQALGEYGSIWPMCYSGDLQSVTGERTALLEQISDKTLLPQPDSPKTAANTEDAQVNGVYQKLLSKLATDQNAKQKLIAAQKAWIAYSVASAGFASRIADGDAIQRKILEFRIMELTSMLNPKPPEDDLCGYSHPLR